MQKSLLIFSTSSSLLYRSGWGGVSVWWVWPMLTQQNYTSGWIWYYRLYWGVLYQHWYTSFFFVLIWQSGYRCRVMRWSIREISTRRCGVHLLIHIPWRSHLRILDSRSVWLPRGRRVREIRSPISLQQIKSWMHDEWVWLLFARLFFL